ncbi:MAG: hypothetical protein R3B40_32920 [Polyangiales bacterium]
MSTPDTVWHFTRLRVPDSEDALTELERRQLDVVDLKGGYDLGTGDRLGPGAEFEGAFELWDVVDSADQLVATAFGTGMDLVVFAAGETRILGSALQHAFESFDEETTRRLGTATRPAEVGHVLPEIRFPLSSVAERPVPSGPVSVDWSMLRVADPLAPVDPPPGEESWPPIPADGVPSQVRRLAFGTEGESKQAEHLLRYALSGAHAHGDVSATPAAIALLRASLPDARWPERVRTLAETLADHASRS